MNIVKKLSLNKTPKDVENYSLVGAKNIAIDDTGSFITNESGLSVAFECPLENEFIVGAIACSVETVIFTYCSIDKVSRIYRLKDNGSYVECSTGWTYSGGKIVGSYTYNYKGELIIAVGEYNAVDIYGNKLYVPLKSWNLDNNSASVSYGIEELINPFTSNYVISSNGNLLSGVYTIFIRFKVSEATYTKWFQVTDDIIITNQVNKERPTHTYVKANNNDVTSAAPTDFDDFFVNDDGLSNKSIDLTFTFGDTLYTEYQIGYVYKRNSEVLGRIKNTYSIGTTSISLNNNVYIEDTDVDSLIRNPQQFYNVKNIINYNNRLYIANYDEYRNDNLQSFADKVNVNIITRQNEAEYVDVTTYTRDVTINIANGTDEPYNLNKVVKNVPTYENNGSLYISSPYDFIRENIAKNLYIKNLKGDYIIVADDYIADIYDGFVNQIQISYWLTLVNKTPHSYDNFYFYVSNVSNINYKLKLKDTGNNTYGIVLITNENKEYDLTTNNYGFNIMQEIRFYTVHDGINISYFPVYTTEEEEQEGATPSPEILHHGVNITFAGQIFSNTERKYIEDKYNNSRTLIPNQVYNFYIHYIRKDYSSTNGFKIMPTRNNNTYDIYTNNNNDTFFKIKPSSTNNPINLPIFSNIEVPKNYIGCFFTYEEVERTCIPVVITNEDATENNNFVVRLSNTNFAYNGAALYGTVLKATFASDNYSDIDGVLEKSQLLHPNLKVTLNHGAGGQILDPDVLLMILIDNKNIYTKTVKTLYRLTENVFSDTTTEDNAFMFLPGFYNSEKVVWYDKLNGDSTLPDDLGFIISATANNVIAKNGTKTEYKIYNKLIKNYSDTPLTAYSIKQDYIQGAAALVKGDSTSLGVYYNRVLSPDKVKDFLELKACYSSKPLKTYTNYSTLNTDSFNKTIYRSNVISDESIINEFRNFEPNNYKNIFENKGNITNIIGIGLYFIVHTEYSLYVFDRSPKLSTRTQIDIPDVFDIDYKEVMPSNEGFGGLADKEESILTKNGYIWFDKINKYIFSYENGKARILSVDIHNFIKYLDIYTVRFAEDIINNRLLICVYLNNYWDEENKIRANITISYNFNTSTFISLHDYSFTDNFRTYNKSYLFDKYKDRKRLYCWDKNSNTYNNLVNSNNTYFPMYNAVSNETIENEENTQQSLDVNFDDSYIVNDNDASVNINKYKTYFTDIN